jgi:hypothetical protein
MSYIYIYIYMEHLFLMFLDHTWIFVCCECRVLSGRDLCDELIARPEESYQLWCIIVCDLETSRICTPYIYDISTLRVKVANLYGSVHTNCSLQHPPPMLVVLYGTLHHVTQPWP